MEEIINAKDVIRHIRIDYHMKNIVNSANDL